MTNKIICNAEDLTAIADAVRASNGSTNTYNVPELSAAAVNAIGNGGAGVNIDDTLTVSGAAADAKVTGDRIATLNEEKMNLPQKNGVPNHGTAGQFAVSDGKGGIVWKTLVEAEEVAY